MVKQKQFTRPPKKQKNKPLHPQTADDFQEAADLEEETGGKWRAGDAAKSGRAYVRALDIYEKGLQKYPANFDLAYNKARLELEITQRPPLVSHIGLPLVDLLTQTLESHRYALRLNEENPDVLFNTSQVLTSLAEQLTGASDEEDAIPLLQESLELLSSCLSRQEMLMEQQRADFEDAEEGGVALDPDEKPASASGSDESEQTATIESPVTANDLLDTVHASLAALTTLCTISEQHSLQTLGDLAQSLTEAKSPAYIGLLPEDTKVSARFALALARANFIAAFADAQFTALMIEAETYLTRLDAFDIPDKEQDATALVSEADARTELVLSVMARLDGSPGLSAMMCWQQLKLAQDLYTKATALESTAQTYLSRGDVELLRHNIAILPDAKLSDAIRRSAPTLVQNAGTYYRGASRLATDEEADVALKAQQRSMVVTCLRRVLYDAKSSADGPVTSPAELMNPLQDCIDHGLLDAAVGDELAKHILRTES